MVNYKSGCPLSERSRNNLSIDFSLQNQRMLSLALLFLAACLDIGMACESGCRPGWNYFEGKCYDKCRPGWRFSEGKCYGFGETEVTWANAQMICRALGARLVETKTSEENVNVAMLAVMKHASAVWVSATDIFHEGMWQWTSGPNTFLSSYTNWGPDEPNNKGEKHKLEDCMELNSHTGYRWNDRACNWKGNFVCVEIPRIAEPETKDLSLITDRRFTSSVDN